MLAHRDDIPPCIVQKMRSPTAPRCSTRLSVNAHWLTAGRKIASQARSGCGMFNDGVGRKHDREGLDEAQCGRNGVGFQGVSGRRAAGTRHTAPASRVAGSAPRACHHRSGKAAASLFGTGACGTCTCGDRKGWDSASRASSPLLCGIRWPLSLRAAAGAGRQHGARSAAASASSRGRQRCQQAPKALQRSAPP